MKRVVLFATVVLGVMLMLPAVGSGLQDADVLFQDRFNNDRSGWKRDARWSYADDDQYRVFVGARNAINFSELPDPSLFGLDEFCVDVDIKIFLGSSLAEDGFVGFYIGGETARRTNFPAATVFGLEGGGSMFILGTVDNGSTVGLDVVELVPFVVSNANQFHKLRLDAANGEVAVSVDGNAVTTVNVNTVGEMGFMAFTFNQPNLNARFDNLFVYDTCPQE